MQSEYEDQLKELSKTIDEKDNEHSIIPINLETNEELIQLTKKEQEEKIKSKDSEISELRKKIE